MLPDDILRIIFSYLPHWDWMNFRMSSKQINQAVTNYEKAERATAIMNYFYDKLQSKREIPLKGVYKHIRGVRPGGNVCCLVCRHYIYIHAVIHCKHCRKFMCDDCQEFLGAPQIKMFDDKICSKCYPLVKKHPYLQIRYGYEI